MELRESIKINDINTMNKRDTKVELKEVSKIDDDMGFYSSDDDVAGAFGSPNKDYFKSYKLHNRNQSKMHQNDNILSHNNNNDINEVLLIDYENETFKDETLKYGQKCVYSKSLDKYFSKIDDKKIVFISIHINRISEIDNVKENFRCNFWISFSWLPTFYEYKEFHLSKKNDDLMDYRPHWVPIISFPESLRTWKMNFSDIKKSFGKFTISNLFSENSENNMDELGYDPNKCEFIRCKLECDIIFSSPFFLFNFPVDCQDLAITVFETSGIIFIILYYIFHILYMWLYIRVSIYILIGICEFIPETRKKHFASATTISSIMEEWSFHNMIAEIGTIESSNLTSIKIRLKMKRRFEVYLYNIVFYMATITGLVLTSFGVDDDNLGERLSIIITLLLTAVAYQSNLSLNLPNVPYLTLLDKYIITCFLFMGIVAIETALLSTELLNFTQHNNIMLIITFGVFLLYHIIFVIKAYKLKKFETKKLYLPSNQMINLMKLKSKKLQVEWKNFKNIGSQWKMYSAKDFEKIPIAKQKLKINRNHSVF